MAAEERSEGRAESAWHRQEQQLGEYRPREAVGCQSPAPGFARCLANAEETGPDTAEVLRLNSAARRTDGSRLQGLRCPMDVF